MIKAKYESGGDMNEENIIDEAMTFFLAGHETTATTLVYLTYILSKHQDVQEKLRNEIITHLGDRDPTPEDLKKLKYFKSVIKETMRFFVLFPVLSRYTTHDVEFKSTGYKIPKGTAIGLNILGLHMAPSIWDNPNEFDPSRYEEHHDEHENARTTAFQYLPFSGGPRNCIGQKFALQEVEITLAILLRKIRFVDISPKDIQHVVAGSMHPKEIYSKIEVL